MKNMSVFHCLYYQKNFSDIQPGCFLLQFTSMIYWLLKIERISCAFLQHHLLTCELRLLFLKLKNSNSFSFSVQAVYSDLRFLAFDQTTPNLILLCFKLYHCLNSEDPFVHLASYGFHNKPQYSHIFSNSVIILHFLCNPPIISAFYFISWNCWVTGSNWLSSCRFLLFT